MRLLILTQKVDINDSNLGFFHRWLEEFSKYCESIIVVCLQKGEYHLPQNVRVLSLGKESGQSRIKYFWNFYKYIWQERRNYDGVFGHMNTEYVILGGWLWRIWGKKILLWYTHKAVGWRLRFAEKLVARIFTASKESFRLESQKVEIVGHGINVGNFSNQQSTAPFYKENFRLLAVGRLAPAKDLKTIIRAVGLVRKNIPTVSLDIVGEPILDSDCRYKKILEELVKQEGLGQVVRFAGGARHVVMPAIYQSHHLLIHASQTGSVDKVVLEALAAGCPVITSSQAYGQAVEAEVVYTFPEGDCQELTETIEKIYNSGIIVPNKKAIEFVSKHHNLNNVIAKIANYFKV